MNTDRRRFLTYLAAGGLLATTANAATVGAAPLAGPDFGSSSAPDTRLPLPDGPISAIAGKGNSLALTVDDGADSDVVGAYIDFARQTGARFTFFVTGVFDSWRENRDALRPFVESGQIQLGNHSWSHPYLTKLTPAEVRDELARTKAFLLNEFGVDGTPFYRPPYGHHNAEVDAVAAELGYTTPTMWYGSLSDSGLITEEYLLECARKYFNPQAIVIGHANHPPVTRVFPELLDLIRERGLAMVTLNDVYR